MIGKLKKAPRVLHRLDLDYAIVLNLPGATTWGIYEGGSLLGHLHPDIEPYHGEEYRKFLANEWDVRSDLLKDWEIWLLPITRAKRFDQFWSAKRPDWAELPMWLDILVRGKSHTICGLALIRRSEHFERFGIFHLDFHDFESSVSHWFSRTESRKVEIW
jgi:hypothetical protein